VYNEIAGKEDEAMSSGFSETIEKLRSEIEASIATLKTNPAWEQMEKLYRALTTIEDLADEQPRTSLVDLFGFGNVEPAARSARVKQGEYFGLEALDASKRYLKRKGEAATLDEIMSAVIETGRANKVDKDQLRMSLSRSTWDVAKVDEDLYGLLEFFPHIKRGKKKGAVSQQAEGKVNGVETQQANANESPNSGDKVSA
jgi:hypothetical protein